MGISSIARASALGEARTAFAVVVFTSSLTFGVAFAATEDTTTPTQVEAAKAPEAATEATATQAEDATSTSAQSAVAIDPFAEHIIANLSEFLGGLDAFVITANVTTEHVLASGQKIGLERQIQLQVRRPDKLRVELLTERGRSRIFYDAGDFTLHHLDLNVYTKAKVAPVIDGMVDDLKARFDIGLPLADLLVSDVFENYEENVVSASYVGLHYLNGVKHHHLLLANEVVDYQIWIEDGLLAIPRKIVMTDVRHPEMPQVTAHIKQWDFSPLVPDLVFRFSPPADADEIEIIRNETEDQKEAKE